MTWDIRQFVTINYRLLFLMPKSKRSDFLEEMKKYKVEITEVLKKEVEVMATSEANAREQAELEWDEGKHVLSPFDNFHSSNFVTLAEIERSDKPIMKEFDIEITEFLKRTVTVQAENADEAMDLVHDQHSQGIHVLDAGDFADMTIETKAERELTPNLLDVLLVEPMKAPKEVQIADTLEALQEAVGGLIEPFNFTDDPVVIVCNEEGKLTGLPLNRAIYDEQGEMVEIMAGSFLIMGDGEENFESLSNDMKEKYAKEFEAPEKFFKLAGKIIAQKVELPKDKDTVKKEMER